MNAEIIVARLLSEDSYYYAFDGEPYGYLGIVDAGGFVTATVTNLDNEHQDMGYSFHDARWRFATNRATPTVCWSNEYTDVQRDAVTHWLEARGHRVAGHTLDRAKWLWP